MHLSGDVAKSLLEDGDPSVRLGVLRDLLDRPATDPDVAAARAELGTKGWSASILAGQQEPGHWERFDGSGDDLYRPKYIATNWRLLVLSDLGMDRTDPRIDRAARLLLRYWGEESDGVFGQGGSETCITGNSVRMLARFGYLDEPEVRAGLRWLVGAQKPDGGWHCFPSETGTLDAWEALAAFAAVPPPQRNESIRRSIEKGAEFYLDRGLLRESDGSTYEPWHRLHYPHHYYYDLLVGLDVLTALGFGDDPRLKAPLEELERKRLPDGTWALEAVHPDLLPSDPYHPEPPIYPFLIEYPGLRSQWATFLALRVLRRSGRL